MSRKTELEKIIEEANEKYWSTGASSISDQEYDRLVEELRKLDPENKLVAQLPEAERGGKVKHSRKMLSLAKAYSLEEVLKWAKKVSRGPGERFLVQPKYDGISGILEKSGVFSSRGDGDTGEDYTEKMKLMDFQMSDPEARPMLGEVLITDEKFKWMQAAGVTGKTGQPFKNQRNAVAGIMGQDELPELKRKPLEFIQYGVHSREVTAKELEARWDELKSWCRSLGVPVDGVVVKLADGAYSDSLGHNGHHPYGAVAFKYTNASSWTVLKRVELTMGKQQLTALGEVEPVDITGTTVKHVKLQLTKPVASEVTTCLVDGTLCIGDEVLIERAGDIIPHVVQSKPGKHRERFQLPDRCPYCGEKLEVNETSVKCMNSSCPAQVIVKLAAAMKILGMKDCAESFAKRLYEEEGCRSAYDMLTVKLSGGKREEKFSEEQKKALKSLTVAKALEALCLPGVGKKKAEELAKSGSYGGYGAKDSKLVKLAEKVQALKKPEAPKPSGAKGKVCFTGKMQSKRSEMFEKAEKAGWEPVDYVDKTVKLLVCADMSSGSSKMKKAEKLGIEVKTEQEFLSKLENA